MVYGAFSSNPIQDRIDALVALQGTDATERDLLTSPIDRYEPVDSPGANSTYIVGLASGTVAFHKPFSGVAVSTCGVFGHGPDEPPLHEAAAWRLAAALGARSATSWPCACCAPIVTSRAR